MPRLAAPARSASAFALTLVVLLAACQDASDPLAPKRPSRTQIPGSPVVNSLADPGDGVCDDSECTLREAIAAAGTGPVTFSVTGTLTLTQGPIVIDKNLTITGPGAASVRVSGNGTGRVFQIAAGTNVTLSGLTITGGHNDNGGSILNDGTLLIQNSTISGSTATNGGGIFNDGALVVQNSTISGNSASNTGGGVINYGAGTLTLRNSTISGNMGRFGGGITGYGGTVRIENSTASGNSAQVYGGGVYNFNGTALTLQNSTFASNSAAYYGAGIYNHDGSTVTLQNSIIASSGGINDCYDSFVGEAITDNGHNLVRDGSCLHASTSRSGDPMLGPLRDNGGPTLTHALLPGSPAIDAIPSGSNGCGISTDQRGVTRPQGAGCDIGAFEKQPPTITVSIDPNGTLTRKTGTATVSGAVTCSEPVAITLDVSLSQQQTKGKATTTVTGSRSVPVSCSGSTAWSAGVSATSGTFASGSASATAGVHGATPPIQAAATVLLK